MNRIANLFEVALQDGKVRFENEDMQVLDHGYGAEHRFTVVEYGDVELVFDMYDDEGQFQWVEDGSRVQVKMNEEMAKVFVRQFC